MKLCICGLGYVGAVTAACLAKAGHTVAGVEIDPRKLEKLRNGQAPVNERGLQPLVRQLTASGALSVSAELPAALEQAEATLICVGTGSRADGALDIAAVQRVCEEIGRSLRGRQTPHTVILRSTVLPGACRNTLIPTLEESAGRACDDDLGFCYNPAFLREGTALRDFYCPPYTIIGHDNDQHGSLTAALYAHLAAPLEKTSLETAELLKVGCNAFHALKVAFANELQALAHEHASDAAEALRLLSQDLRLNLSPQYLAPGFAFGGSCLPKDLRALTQRAAQLHLELPLLSAVLPSNDAVIERAFERIRAAGKARVGLLGLAYKPGTDDLRGSAAVRLAQMLEYHGFKLRLHDTALSADAPPEALAAPLRATLGTLEEVLAHADVLVICNAEARYAAAGRSARAEQLVIDLANALAISDRAGISPVRA